MNRTDIPLKDAFVIQVDKYKDRRGFFLESYNSNSFKEIGLDVEFVQDNHSNSSVNVLRGLHYQVEKPQGKLVRCMSGRILDVIVDLRESSETFGESYSIDLHSPEVMLWVPPGFAHGFYCMLDNCHVAYKTTDYYYKEYDRTLLWNDKDLGIPWSTPTPILSDKDKLGKTMSECEKYD
jgi:dTDP-4-dehydrorhamnose 3,5-epimerase